MTLGPLDDTAALDADPIQRAEIRDLQTRFGVVAWFGHFTRHWWALDDNRLVEGANPARLGDAVMAARRWAR